MSRLGNENAPSEFVTLDCVTPVALCFTATLAPGTMAPVLSTTTPESVLVVFA